MKKTMMVMVVILISTIMCYSQERMSFKGIPFTENLNSFVQKLKDQGYSLTKSDQGAVGYVYELSGNFAGYSNCEVYVLGSLDNSMVYRVTVYLPEMNAWYDLRSKFTSLRESFTKKYGEANSSYEFFDSPYYNGDGYEMTAVQAEKCNYGAFWHFSYGDISLLISKYKQIKIAYEDKINNEQLEKVRANAVDADI